MQQDKGDKGMEYGQKMTMQRRWDAIQVTKTAAIWSWVAVAAVTMIVGFAWGGWVTGGTAQAMGEKMALDAVVTRLGPMCVTQFQQAPGKEQKLKDLEKVDSWQRSEFIEKQGWATMPGAEKADRNVAEACAKLLLASK